MYSVAKAVTFLALFTEGITAQKRSFLKDFSALDASSDRVPPAAGFSIQTWPRGTFPQWCYDTARSQRSSTNSNVNCPTANLEAFSVTYNDRDCASRPWVLCRCTDSNVSRDQMARDFGRVPPGIRSRVVHALSIRETGASAGSNNDRILFRGPVQPAVYLHESMHSVDQNFHSSSEFTTAYNQDSCVPDDYANSSPAEDFAQLGVWISYDTNPKTKVRSYVGDFSCMGHQLETVGRYAGEQLNTATSRCFDRRPNDANVTVQVQAARVQEQALPPVKWEFEDFF